MAPKPQAAGTVSPPRKEQWIDCSTVRHQVDLPNVATALLGPPAKQLARYLLWRCPFHDDHDPSLQVDPVKKRWKCWPCGAGGDAINLVMRVKQCPFPDAIRWLANEAGVTVAESNPPAPRRKASRTTAPTTTPTPPLIRQPEHSSSLPLADALTLVESAAARIWQPEGLKALAYVTRRGLSHETIRRHRLGWTPGEMIPKRNGAGSFTALGIVIPWLAGDQLRMVNIRQPAGRTPKYARAFSDRPAIYPSPAAVRQGKWLVITEGEFDALLLGQRLDDLAAVVTIGSASNQVDSRIIGAILQAPRLFIATDADSAGERAAKQWPAHAVRVRPPSPYNDWSDAHQAGVDLRRWWSDLLAGIDAPELFTWAELALRRWGPATGDPTPGIVIR